MIQLLREFYVSKPNFRSSFEEILCKKEVQNFFIRELATNNNIDKELNEPVIFLSDPVIKTLTQRLDLSSAYMACNTYQTQLALAAPNPKYLSISQPPH